MHCICYELEISQEKNFVAILRPAKSAKFFYLENFRLYGMCIAPSQLNILSLSLSLSLSLFLTHTHTHQPCRSQTISPYQTWPTSKALCLLSWHQTSSVVWPCSNHGYRAVTGILSLWLVQRDVGRSYYWGTALKGSGLSRWLWYTAVHRLLLCTSYKSFHR